MGKVTASSKRQQEHPAPRSAGPHPYSLGLGHEDHGRGSCHSQARG